MPLYVLTRLNPGLRGGTLLNCTVTSATKARNNMTHTTLNSLQPSLQGLLYFSTNSGDWNIADTIEQNSESVATQTDDWGAIQWVCG